MKSKCTHKCDNALLFLKHPKVFFSIAQQNNMKSATNSNFHQKSKERHYWFTFSVLIFDSYTEWTVLLFPMGPSSLDWKDLILISNLPSSYDTSEWNSPSLHALMFSASQHNRKRPWARIDSDVWVTCSVCQMNSDSMFITLLHTALYTHAVFKINKQPSLHLPLSWTKIDLALQIHQLLGRNHTRPQTSLAGMTTHIVHYQAL